MDHTFYVSGHTNPEDPMIYFKSLTVLFFICMTLIEAKFIFVYSILILLDFKTLTYSSQESVLLE